MSKAAAHGQGGTVEFARSGKTVTVDAATPLMDAGEGVGVRMPFGCRMGICQSCVVGLVDGHVRDLRTGAEHEAGSPDPDLYFRSFGRLRTGHIRFTGQ